MATDFNEICSFETDNYVGMWNHDEKRFILLAKVNCVFRPISLPECNDFIQLSTAVYEKCGEYIFNISNDCCYSIFMIDKNKWYERLYT